MMVALEKHVDDLYGLLLHVFFWSAVLDDEVRHFALLLERHLRDDSLFGFCQWQIVAIHQSSDLNVFLGRNTNDLVNVIDKVWIDFKQQRQFENDEVLAKEKVFKDFLVNRSVNDWMCQTI